MNGIYIKIKFNLQEKEKCFGLMENIILENIKMIRNMVKDISFGKMERNIQEGGIKENNMERVN